MPKWWCVRHYIYIYWLPSCSFHNSLRFLVSAYKSERETKSRRCHCTIPFWFHSQILGEFFCEKFCFRFTPRFSGNSSGVTCEIKTVSTLIRINSVRIAWVCVIVMFKWTALEVAWPPLSCQICTWTSETMRSCLGELGAFAAPVPGAFGPPMLHA